MQLEDLKVMNRFKIMNNLTNSSGSIETKDISQAIEILHQREIGIPKELLYQEYLYRAQTLGTGLKGYFIGTQPAWHSLVIFLLFSLVAPLAVLVVGHLTIQIILSIAAFSVYVCRNNTETNIIFILSILLVAQHILRVMFDVFVFSTPYII